MIGRADIEGSKSNVATNAWLPQASYPWGNYSDTSRSTLRKKKTLERINGPRFRGHCPHWRLRSSRLLPFCSTADFRPAWADLGTPALPFDRCAAPAKLPTRHCPRFRSRSPSRLKCRGQKICQVSQETSGAVVFHRRLPPWEGSVSHLSYTSNGVSWLSQTRVKLYRVFFPRWCVQVRSLGCGFAR